MSNGWVHWAKRMEPACVGKELPERNIVIGGKGYAEETSVRGDS